MKYTLTVGMLLVAAVLGVTPTARASTEWHVNGVTGSDSNNCLSATTPCKTIGHAILLASSGDSIIVAPATYKENLNISISLTITGAGSSTTIIDGGGVNTVVTVSSTSAQVSLSGVTIKNGTGGGIFNPGTLTVNRSTITANRASGAGGGVYNKGTMTILESTISGNEVQGRFSICYRRTCYYGAHGAGIYNEGTLTLLDTTVSGNTIVGNVNCGKGCIFYAWGGGIRNYSGSLDVANTTITVNSVSCADAQTCVPLGGGMYLDPGGNVWIRNSTISRNSIPSQVNSEGGGIFNAYGSIATTQNTIIADNAVGNCIDTMTSNGYNLSSDNTCNFNGPGDMNNTDPMLGTLGNYGGPTKTIPLLPGSPAIDAGNPNGCTDGNGHLLKTDQRGKPRPDKEDTGGCDLGAYELQSD